MKFVGQSMQINKMMKRRNKNDNRHNHIFHMRGNLLEKRKVEDQFNYFSFSHMLQTIIDNVILLHACTFLVASFSLE